MSVSQANGEDATIYKVVVNHEEQYSIWPDHRENPRGWSEVGVRGTKAECLAHIESVWTDMRPLSLRRAMEAAAAAPVVEPVEESVEPLEESLPVRLSGDQHPVELNLGTTRTIETLLRQVDTGYVHVHFTATRGGTTLAVPLESGVAERIKAATTQGADTVQVSGALTLDYVPVRCVADIDLATLAGTGRLEISESPAS
jgi:uncharacterized protein YbdZ (MbtH family)